MASRRTPSPYTIAFVLLMLVAGGEACSVASLVAQQHTEATVSNLGGPQRMRTQRIAFLAERAIDPGLAAREQAELATAIDTFRTTQSTLDDDPSTRVGVVTDDGSTDLERAVDRYSAAAGEVLAHPKTARSANAYILDHRVPLLLALDKAVEAKKAASEARIRQQWAAVIGLLVLMSALVAAAWRFVVVPLERMQAQSREQLRSLFEDNPEAVVTYDLNGRVLDANAAALALTGSTLQQLRETTFADSIAAERRSDAFLAFARSAAGDPTKLETTVVRSDGGRVLVSTSLLPSIVDGRIDGVYAIARDVTQERKSEREVFEAAKRIRELYLVAAAVGESSEAQISRALELGYARLGLEWGFVASVDDSIATIRNSAGAGPFDAGASVRIDKRFIKRALTTHDLVVIDDPRHEPVATDDIERASRLKVLVIFPIEVEGRSIAAVGFASTQPLAAPLTNSDRDFVRLIGALIGASIERGEAKRRLDAMAFSDALTGLPNRASLDASIEDLIGRARRGDDRFAVHFLDLDGFKRVNDERGHAAGDELLGVVATRIANAIGPHDIAARLGGDEFIILQPHIGNEVEAERVAERIIEAIGAPILIDEAHVFVGASIGIAMYPENGTDVKTLFANADRALYRAKSAGRGRFESATSRLAS